jgi:Fic-DOC domain mobile mystery protein B
VINDYLPSGATPLTPDDAKGLIPKGISTRGHLNQFESANIQQALIWAIKSKKQKPSDLLNIDCCLKLHKKMFDKTWIWAGKLRRYEVNIGNTPPEQVSVQLKNLCDDAQAWIEFKAYSYDELCIRFHHRMVYIHPFPNGNGRHSRIMADLLLKSLGEHFFTWGNKANLTTQTKSRAKYLSALRAADKGDFKNLLTFART